MCGILLTVRPAFSHEDGFEKLWQDLMAANTLRGPDAQNCIISTITVPNRLSLDVRCFTSELQLRGNLTIIQPHTSLTTGDIFCWNGEVFEGLNVELDENDGVELFHRLQDMDDPNADLPDVLQSIEGPYSFAYFHKASNSLYFARDPLGRRSLLVHWPTSDNPTLLLTSVSVGSQATYDFEELSTEHIFCLNLNNWPTSSEVSACDAPTGLSCLRIVYDRVLNVINNDIPSAPPVMNVDFDVPVALSICADELIGHLKLSVSIRIRNVPSNKENGHARIAILFSGGIDCSILAFLADLYVPAGEPIDLLNVAFENPRKIQSSNMPSGKKRKARAEDKEGLGDSATPEEHNYLVPDRITGLEELEELQKLCPNRRWNFIEINVPFEESSKARSYVENLMHPQRTVMDMSLGLALFFASRGVGVITADNNPCKVSYNSTARVLLSGLGSDELMGGYARHRTAFAAGGWAALNRELQLEINRIPTRNLGRDDRIVSSHGKELRLPFLSLSLVKHLASLPVHLKVDPRLPPGAGDKMLLRVATRRLGLVHASGQKKRAMQFGSQSARMEIGGNEKHGDIVLDKVI